MINRTYSLNMITYLQTKGINVDIKTDEGYKFYGEYESTPTAEAIVQEYKQDKQLHAFLEQFKALRSNIKSMRASY